MEQQKSILELISEVTELNEVHLYLQDADVDQALGIIIRLIAKPDTGADKAPALIVLLQSLSSKFAIMGKFYMLYDTDETKEAKTRKKNTYLTLSAELEKLSNALKYLAKA